MPNRALAEFRRFPFAVTGYKYGIEVEIEHIAPGGLPPLVGWDQIADHSLRGRCAELITPPSSAETLKARLNSVYALRRAGAWAPTIRCGIHIHANVRWARPTELRAMLQRYIMAEPLLFLMMGPEREQSNFCVPWYRSMSTIKGVAETLYRWEHQDLVSPDQRLSKYSALNLLPLEDKGTIEFRHAPTFDTEERAQEWLDVVVAIVEGKELPVNPDLAEVGRQRGLLLDTETLAASLVRTREKVPAEAWGVPASMRLAPLAFPKRERRERPPRIRTTADRMHTLLRAGAWEVQEAVNTPTTLTEEQLTEIVRYQQEQAALDELDAGTDDYEEQP